MSVVRLKGVKRYRHPKTGVWYSYHRASGTRLEPPHVYGSAEFMEALAACERAQRAKEPTPHTWAAAVKSYRASPDYGKLKPRTKADYEKVLGWLAGYDDVALSTFTTPRCYKLRDKAFREKKRRFANYVSTLLAIILAHAVKYGMGIEANPAAGMDKIAKSKHDPEANVAWMQDEIEAFLAAAPPHVAAPFATAVHLGMRGEDVVMLPKTAYKGAILHARTGKTGIVMPYPVPDELRARLDALPAHNGMRLFVNSRGKPWTTSGFRHVVFDLRNELAEQGKLRRELTLHGLRTTFAQEAAELGLEEKQIADGLGHRDTKATRGYVRNAGRERNVKNVVQLVARNRKAT